ncbi:MrcB family domain-containing protein [Streptomyces sp. NPDC048718]|uniref:MrcB family domain-containing protein n=1 Tax=Streptomyces sp. NPDC048718 TaxID=3365587 RepID=UPI003718B368
MGIQDMLSEVARTYDRNAGSGRDVKGQQVLRAVAGRTDLALPPGFRAKGHGGQTTPAATPWIGIFEEKGQSDPKHGLYLAYIFSADLKNVSLTLQQGITWLEERLGKGKAREQHLRREAARLRRALQRQERQGWIDEPRFRDKADRPRAYEAASVIAKTYDTSALPSDVALMEDLLRGMEFLRLTEMVNQIVWEGDSPDSPEISYDPGEHAVPPVDDPLANFLPKDSGDYEVQIRARQQVKRRTHEALIKDFGLHVAARGYEPITRLQHPKDLVLRPQGASGESGEWLVEAKVVRNGNPTQAVREALGQLFEYQHFLYLKKPEPFLVGLFSEEIGAYAPYLEKRGIASIWRDGDGWDGSSRAQEWGMTS